MGGVVARLGGGVTGAGGERGLREGGRFWGWEKGGNVGSGVAELM